MVEYNALQLVIRYHTNHVKCHEIVLDFTISKKVLQNEVFGFQNSHKISHKVNKK